MLKNTVMEYEWGSFTDIPNLLGEKTPSKTPQAELWIGAHPKAPSMVQVDDKWCLLTEIIKKNPELILGKQTALKYKGKLPYLLKVLAASQPLSIQAHPNLKQAREGFLKENKQGILLNAPNRNYKDDNHKPECICALTSFYTLNGFRKISDIIFLLKKTCDKGLKNEYSVLKNNRNPYGLKKFFSSLMNMDQEKRKNVVGEAVNNAIKYSNDDILFEWLVKLNDFYPDDIGVLSPLFLNLVCLEPGQAMFLGPGELHSYLNGTGIELMANSDNVLRGGLTPKHVDVQELLNTLTFMEKNVQILEPIPKRKHEMIYECNADEFILSVIKCSDGSEYISSDKRSAEIIICVDGNASVFEQDGKESLPIKKGDSVIILSSAHIYKVKGRATLYKASTPVC